MYVCTSRREENCSRIFLCPRHLCALLGFPSVSHSRCKVLCENSKSALRKRFPLPATSSYSWLYLGYEIPCVPINSNTLLGKDSSFQLLAVICSFPCGVKFTMDQINCNYLPLLASTGQVVTPILLTIRHDKIHL